ncbi:hypothetical protein WJ966_22535 [Achromobacter xylosoxidans]
MVAAPIVMEPLSFDWKTPLPELLDGLRQAYAARYPALAAARLDALRAALRDDRADDFLPPLGQELEALGLALIEQDEDDDAIHLLIVPRADAGDTLARIAAQGRQGTRHRQAGAPQGAPAALPRPASGPLAQPGDYLDMTQCVPLAPGWACMANRDTAAPQLVDLHDWPALREVGGKFQPHRGLLASAVAANGVHAWIEQGPDGIASTPYAHLLRAPGSRPRRSTVPALRCRRARRRRSAARPNSAWASRATTCCWWIAAWCSCTGALPRRTKRPPSSRHCCTPRRRNAAPSATARR